MGDPLATAARIARSAPPGAQRVMIVGNSVAYYLAQSMQRVRTTPPIAVFNAALVACTFPPAATRSRGKNGEGATITEPTIPCHPSWEAAAVRTFRPNVVFWVMSDPPTGGVLYRNLWLLPCSEPYGALYRQSLSREVSALGATGAKVVITTAAYPRYFLHGPDRLTECDNRLRRAAAAQIGAPLVDLARYICPNGECRTEQNGVVLRPDGLHYEGAGGEIVARWLIEQARSSH